MSHGLLLTTAFLLLVPATWLVRKAWLKAPQPCHSCFVGSCVGCRSQREYSTSCACLCTRCSSGTFPITLPACRRPPQKFLHGRRCVRIVTVTWSYQERVGRLAFSVAAPRAWNRLPTDLKLLRFDCFMLLTPGTLCELWNAPSV